MPRFYIDPPTGDTVVLEGENARHISRSLRMAVGEELTLCDGAGTDYLCRLSAMDGQTVTAQILSCEPCQAEPTVFVRLYQALPKSDKMELILQKAVELGVGEVIPVLTERCISRPDPKSMEKKLSRWQKIALEAAKQCGRGRIPAVRPLMSFSEAASELGQMEKGLFLYEKGGQPLKAALSEPAKEIGIFVGAEGGFSPDEAAAAEEAGAQPTSLGPRILRCETAPLAALSAILYETGNF
ncbi:MAG: 16S rRNA (uracil(1498)-N(3))-methyltransferase [Oscillospiraceae bacterium]|nr:16S rRNA (uracil(1498)-N(3))-methyltransferase [Oscillospiraceae bacterium]